MFCLFELLRCNSILDLYKNPKTEFQISIWVLLIVLHDKNDFEHPIFRRRHWWSTLGFNGYVAHGKLGLQTISQCLHEPQLLVEGNYRYYMRLKQSKLIHKVHSSVYDKAEYSKKFIALHRSHSLYFESWSLQISEFNYLPLYLSSPEETVKYINPISHLCILLILSWN